jgi:hypothetical protein
VENGIETQMAGVRMKRRVISIISTVAFMALVLAPILLPDGRQRRHWSIDLVSYGFHVGVRGDAHDYISDAKVAASENVVALAMNYLAPGSQIVQNHGYAEARWNYFLLLFDENSGKLLVRRGPWTANLAFDLFATSQGNLILDLHNYHGPGRNGGETLLLFSPAGEQLRELDLPPASKNPERHEWSVSISPTRNTVLVTLSDGDVNRYEVLDANTLEEQLEGTQSSSDPAIVAISDEQMLGAMSSAQRSPSPVLNPEREFYIRPFHGTWQHVMDSSGDFVFLSEHRIAGLQELGYTSGFLFTVSTTDGTRIMSYTVQKHNVAISGGWPLVQSPDGAYIGCIFVLDSQAWLWRQLDMGPENTELYIWAPPNSIPVFTMKVKSQFAHFAFSPQGSLLAVADEQYLRVVAP